MAVVRSRLEFGYEHEMVEPARNWLLGQGLMVKGEFPVPWGICDLVGCDLDPQKVDERLSLGQRRPIGSLLKFHILSQIPEAEKTRRGVTLSHLAKLAGPYLDESRIERELESLIASKHVFRTATGSYQKKNGWWPLHRRLVAFELKLSRVLDALHQAKVNKGFADESYVGLPLRRAERVAASDLRNKFCGAGVGIVGIGGKHCHVLLEARGESTEPDPILQMHAVERYWRPYLRDNSA